SGSGKTVLMKTIMGLYKPDSGTVLINDIDINGDQVNSEQIKRNFAMVFQNSALLDSYTVFQNVALPLYERDEHNAELIAEKVEQALAVVGLSHTKAMYPAELSGGMKKRIALARALVYEPAFIVFDEPISGLDPITSKEVLYYMEEIIKSRTITAITVTHDIRDLDRIGDHALFIDAGKVLFSGPLNDIFSNPDPLIREFIS
ncbi:MAG TPA: ATP-binding cassette domain-containing protein, partial [Candidatus Cloacimonadota bacterium]|nr:ATP-binding cassette domain-containing protein [Candidatus Cloacimonadota bacterium]